MIRDAAVLHELADLGITLLLFTIGLKLNISKFHLQFLIEDDLSGSVKNRSFLLLYLVEFIQVQTISS